MFNLTGKVALVTGAAQGLGRAMALALADAGADPLLVDRNESGAADTAATILVGRSGFFNGNAEFDYVLTAGTTDAVQVHSFTLAAPSAHARAADPVRFEVCFLGGNERGMKPATTWLATTFRQARSRGL